MQSDRPRMQWRFASFAVIDVQRDLPPQEFVGACRAIGIGAVSVPDRAPPTPPGMRVRTGRFEKLRS